LHPFMFFEETCSDVWVLKVWWLITVSGSCSPSLAFVHFFLNVTFCIHYLGLLSTWSGSDAELSTVLLMMAAGFWFSYSLSLFNISMMTDLLFVTLGVTVTGGVDETVPSGCTH
jgi:hypothetical protein